VVVENEIGGQTGSRGADVVVGLEVDVFGRRQLPRRPGDNYPGGLGGGDLLMVRGCCADLLGLLP